MKMIESFVSDADVCENGCGALWNMTNNGKNTVNKTPTTTNKMNS